MIREDFPRLMNSMGIYYIPNSNDRSIIFRMHGIYLNDTLRAFDAMQIALNKNHIDKHSLILNGEGLFPV